MFRGKETRCVDYAVTRWSGAYDYRDPDAKYNDCGFALIGDVEKAHSIWKERDEFFID